MYVKTEWKEHLESMSMRLSVHQEFPWLGKGRNEKFCQKEHFQRVLFMCQRPVVFVLDHCGWVKSE